MCWLYSVSNLLVIQQLETLYLSRNYVRVMCERVWRFDRVWTFKSILATDLRVVTRQKFHTCEAYRKLKGRDSWITTGKKVQSDHSVIWRPVMSHSRLIPVTSHLTKQPVLQKNDFSHSFSYPTINTLIPTKCRELLERILRDKP